jgi:fatty aldehyde-generating acyl-ACP reductase
MDTFAFIAHPLNLGQLKSYWPLTKIMPDFLFKPFRGNLPPFKISKIKNVRSVQGKEIQGYFIACSLLPEQILELSEDIFFDKILTAVRVADKLNAGIAGLGGYASVFGDKGRAIAKKLKIAVTSGSCLTAWSAYEAIHRIVRLKNKELRKSSLAVVGADTCVGALCAKKFLNEVEKIIICAQSKDKPELLKETLLQMGSAEVVIEGDAHNAVKDADLVINASGGYDVLSDIAEFKPQSIVCDISVLRNLSSRPNRRADVTIIEGGLIKLPYPAVFGINTGLPDDIVDARMAEAMLLTFDRKFVNYSLGENINVDRMEEIANIAVQHGFEVWVPEAPVI